jgi:hypothetical protein
MPKKLGHRLLKFSDKMIIITLVWSGIAIGHGAVPSPHGGNGNGNKK